MNTADSPNIKLKLSLTYLLGMIIMFGVFSAISAWTFFQGIRQEFDRGTGELFSYLERHLEYSESKGYHFRGSRVVEPSEIWVNGQLKYRTSSNVTLPYPEQLNFDSPQFLSIKNPYGVHYRTISKAIRFNDAEVLILTAIEETRVYTALKDFLFNIFVLLVALLPAMALGSYYFAAKALKKSEEYIEMLKNFTSDASHELRTPLAVIRSKCEVALSNQFKNSSPEEILEEVLDETKRMARLTDSLLFLSRVDTGNQRIREKRIKALELSRRVSQTIEPLAEEKQQAIHLIGNDSLEVLGDEDLLFQALFNLTHNAIKYSPVDSPIEIEVVQQNKSVSFVVKDKGPGVPVEQREKIFDRFYRCDDSRSRNTGGTGLGLAIVSSIAKVHKGEVQCKSRSTGTGTVFELVVPSLS